MLEIGILCIKTNRLGEAEKYFKQIIEIHPKNLPARTELSFTYFKKKQFQNRDQILFEIYDLNSKDFYNLVALSKMFFRFKKYRIALKLLESILTMQDDNLVAVIMIINIYKLLKDIKNASLFYQKGKSILSRHRYNKYKEKFLQLKLDTDVDIDAQLLELMNIGIFHEEQKRKYIESNNTHHPLAAKDTCNNRVKNGDTVYFATYKKKNSIYADFIEPYFENLDNVKALK